MKKLILILWVVALSFSISLAQESPKTAPKIILLISEQNIEGPQRAWWASEIDLSATETTIAKRLIEAGFEVLEPSQLTKVLEKERAFRKVDLSDADVTELGNLAQADYVVLGKALASSGANVPQSNFRSCFANLSAGQ